MRGLERDERGALERLAFSRDDQESELLDRLVMQRRATRRLHDFAVVVDHDAGVIREAWVETYDITELGRLALAVCGSSA